VRWALGDHLGTVRDLAVYDPGTGETTVPTGHHFRYDVSVL
jgi:hypothetical protein